MVKTPASTSSAGAQTRTSYAAPVRQPDATEDLDRGGQIEGQDSVQREYGHGVHGRSTPWRGPMARIR